MEKFIRSVTSVLLTCTLICWAVPSNADDYPAKRISIVVPFAPGGPTDALARAIANELQQRWAQPVVVENKPGGGGIIAGQTVARAQPDGYTLFMTSTGFVSTLDLFFKDRPFDPSKDLASVTLIASAPFIITTPTAIPPRTMKDFVAYVKSNPGKLNYATIGGGTMEIDMALFAKNLGLEMVKVPFNGSAPASLSLASNDVQLYFNGVFSSKPMVESGKIVRLATTGERRFSLVPDLPTLKELGMDFTATYAFGILLPGKTPRVIVDKLNKELRSIIEAPQVAQKIAEAGLAATPSTPEEMAKMMEDEAKRYKQGAVVAKIVPQ